MQEGNESHLPDELRGIARQIRAQRVEATPLDLDRIKRRALRQASRNPITEGKLMRSRIVQLLTVALLTLGVGGTFAIAGNSGGTTKPQPSAAKTEYCGQPGPDKDHNGDVHSNCHTGSKGRGAGGEDKGTTR